MYGELQPRLKAIQQALTSSREIVTTGPTDEISLLTLEAIADKAIPRLEQLEIREEYKLDLGEKPPQFESVTTKFGQELYQQLYGSVINGIKPKRDDVVFALFNNELNQGMQFREAVEITTDNALNLKKHLKNKGIELTSSRTPKGLIFDLPAYFREKPSNVTEPENPEHELPLFYNGLPVQSFYEVTVKPNTVTYEYLKFLKQEFDRGVLPTEDAIKHYFLSIGLTEQNLNSAMNHAASKIRRKIEGNQLQTPAPDESDNKNSMDKNNKEMAGSYFNGVDNKDLPSDPLDLFKEGSSSYIYYEYLIQKLTEGKEPSDSEMRRVMLEAGFSEKSFMQTRYMVMSKIRDLFEAEKESHRTIVTKNGVPSGQGFPVFSAPERKEKVIPREIPPKDAELLARMDSFLPVEKAAAITLFDRLSGNSISRAEWIEAIQKACPQNHITSYFLDGIIERLRDNGVKVATSKVGGEIHYYRLGNK